MCTLLKQADKIINQSNTEAEPVAKLSTAWPNMGSSS